LLMFASRNRRTKSRTKRNYAPRLANSWLRHCDVMNCHAPYNLLRSTQFVPDVRVMTSRELTSGSDFGHVQVRGHIRMTVMHLST